MVGRIVWLTALLASVALAGCAEPEPENLAQEMGEESQEADSIPSFGPHSGLPRTPDVIADRTWVEPPQWVLGEWWDIELTDHFTGEVSTFTRVVAGKEGTDYLVGMPKDTFSDNAMIFHFPGFGLVKSQTLGYEAHDFLFEPLKFPLEVDTVWESLWQSANGVMTHHVVDLNEEAGEVYLDAATNQQTLSYTYDIEMGAISLFEAPGYATYRILDHGYDYEGTVRVPHGHDLTFYHGRLGPFVGIAQSAGNGVSLGNVGVNPSPIETVLISEDYDRSSFILAAMELAPFLGAPMPAAGTGISNIEVTAPDGTVYDLTKLATEGGHKITAHAHDFPAGEWTVRTAAASAQQVFIEGVSYVVFDVDLPSGCVALTERVHDHGGDCGGHVHDIQ